MKTIQVPFPLLEGVRNVNKVLNALVARGIELGLNESNSELPLGEILPRSYRWSEKEEVVGEPTISFVLWGGYNGFYVRGLLQGYWDSSYGTNWYLKSIKIRFRPYLGIGAGESKSFSIKMDGAALDAVTSRRSGADAVLSVALADLVQAVEAARAAETVYESECLSRGDEYDALYLV